MADKSPEEMWDDLCKEWESARRNTSEATRKAFKNGWLQEHGVAELNAAYKAEENLRKRMDEFIERHT